MAGLTWEERERPVLEAIAELEEEGVLASIEMVADRTGLSPEVVGRTMKRLHDAGFIEAFDGGGLADSTPMYFGAALLERGLRVVGQWPPDVSDAFLARLDALIDAADDPDEKTRLQRLKSAAADVSKGVVASTIVAAGQWGLT